MSPLFRCASELKSNYEILESGCFFAHNVHRSEKYIKLGANPAKNLELEFRGQTILIGLALICLLALNFSPTIPTAILNPFLFPWGALQLMNSTALERVDLKHGELMFSTIEAQI